jgi:hypothetical protein
VAAGQTDRYVVGQGGSLHTPVNPRINSPSKNVVSRRDFPSEQEGGGLGFGIAFGDVCREILDGVRLN